MSTEAHLSRFELERLFVGETDATPSAHAQGCSSCQRYLEELRDAAAAFAADYDVDAFIARIRARAEEPRKGDRNGHPKGHQGKSRGAYALVASACLAATLILAMGAERPGRDVVSAKGRGRVQVAALVEHAGRQDRQIGDILGAPGDRFRVELGLTSEAVLDAWVVDEKGDLTALCRGRHFAAGTHYLATTLRFEDGPTAARLFVGPEGSLSRARGVSPEPQVPEPQVIVVPIHSREAP